MVKVGCACAREDEIKSPADPPSHRTLISSGGTARRAEGLLVGKLDWNPSECGKADFAMTCVVC